VRFAVGTLYRQADAFIGNCAMQGTDAAAIGVPHRRCHAVTNWVDHDVFRPLDPRAAYRERWGVASTQTAFFFGGRFCPTKHVDRIAEALQGLDDPRAVFFFAGDGVLAPMLHALARSNPNVRVLPTLPRSELPALHAACDVQFWGSVDVDYPGLVVMEAMSCGLPVYTSKESMNTFYPGAPVEPSFLDVPRLARLFPATAEGIRDAVREAIARRDELNALRAQVAAFARARFGTANALRLVEILRATAAPPLTKRAR
jgi:glycosyltransferase involved in cell wall biosynthesis